MAKNFEPCFGKQNDFIRYSPIVLNIEDNENSLRIIYALTKVGEKGEGIAPALPKKLKDALSDSRPVYADNEDVFEIYFSDYLVYQVRNEIFAKRNDKDKELGKWLTVFESSRYLDYNGIAPGLPIKHYGIWSEWQIIDVISDSVPTVRKISLKKEN
ncbi:MAG: hypothetical protein E7656_02670 [Ruminococcaceae bacterium]|nr:hypothetical protein [Oscillospiraceae bacterium]